ncbi:MAG: winged helix-turn-helix transcriptional regulator, partial [Bifidobacteriaceae bacterium]|nr:winged helix-turn-helix transcriptional regulator [Bifidobacteriaceae bacterium]
MLRIAREGEGRLSRQAAAGSTAEAEGATRTQILRLVVADSPISAVEIAAALALAPAGIRRHLGELEADGLIAERAAPARLGQTRGRGRPARYFVATPAAHQALEQEHDSLAVEAIEFLARAAGPAAVGGFAGQRAERLEERYAAAIDGAGSDLAGRTRALAQAMNQDGYAAS